METPFIARDKSCQADKFQISGKGSRMRNHLAYQAFNEAGYNRFPARDKLHNRDPSNSDSPATRARMLQRCAAQLAKINPGIGGIVSEGQTNENRRCEGASVTKPAKPRTPPIKVGGAKIPESPGNRREPGCPGPAKEIVDGPCARKAAAKSGIADQIGLHLRSVYDDVLAQPVPGRFLELLRQLESASSSRLSKDGM